MRPLLHGDGSASVFSTQGKTWGQIRLQLGGPAKEEEERWAEERDLDPFFVTHADPANFVVGNRLTRFLSPDPTPQQVEEYHQWSATDQGNRVMHDFLKWVNSAGGKKFMGEEDVAAVMTWDDTLRFRFQFTRVHNPIAQFMAATATFDGKAARWWRAHCHRRPDLLLTYDQLVEWVKRELVPRADPGTSCMAWADLKFKGDLEPFLRELDHLMNFYPLKHDSMIQMAARPFGSVFVSQMVTADAQYGARGMTYPQLRKIIANHVAANPHLGRSGKGDKGTYNPSYQARGFPPHGSREGGRTFQPKEIRGNAALEGPPKLAEGTRPVTAFPSRSPGPVGGGQGFKPPARPPPPHPSKIGMGATPCYICGSDQHVWLRCPKKKAGKCGCCGADSHLTRHCGQRFHPAPDMRFNFQQLCEAAMEDSAVLLENAPFEEDPQNEEDGTEDPLVAGEEAEQVVACSFQLQPINPAKEASQAPRGGSSFPPLTPIAQMACAKLRNAPEAGRLRADVSAALSDFMQRLSSRTHPPIRPMEPPGTAGQLYYEIRINGEPVKMLLDCGASHSFMRKDWAERRELVYSALSPPRAAGTFNGQKEMIEAVAHVESMMIGNHRRRWNFYVVRHAPAPIVLGMDAVKALPLFYNPIDDSLFVVPALGRPVRQLGVKYESSVTDEGMARARQLAREALELPEGETRIKLRQALAELQEIPDLWVVQQGVARDAREAWDDTILYLHGVTASGQEEEQLLADFKAALPGASEGLSKNSPRCLRLLTPTHRSDRSSTTFMWPRTPSPPPEGLTPWGKSSFVR